MILVCGPTGSGKSTTLAAALEWLNENLSRHVITIEDPIEYLFSNRMSLFTQREVGIDTPSFAEGLRRSLRQNPDVIFVGEIRDAETATTAIDADQPVYQAPGTATERPAGVIRGCAGGGRGGRAPPGIRRATGSRPPHPDRPADRLRRWRPTRPTTPRAVPPGGLAGLRVVDLTTILMGPFATRILADHGADIICASRRWPATPPATASPPATPA